MKQTDLKNGFREDVWKMDLPHSPYLFFIGIGDYAVVLYQGILYPAIVGDIGPASKIGEASLRICRAIDPQSSEMHRPLSAPHVSYIIFLGSAELPFRAPDYSHWSKRCHELWRNLGGSEKVTWHEWDSCEQPWPEEPKGSTIPMNTNSTIQP